MDSQKLLQPKDSDDEHFDTEDDEVMHRNAAGSEIDPNVLDKEAEQEVLKAFEDIDTGNRPEELAIKSSLRTGNEIALLR